MRRTALLAVMLAGLVGCACPPIDAPREKCERPVAGSSYAFLGGFAKILVFEEDCSNAPCLKDDEVVVAKR